MACRTALAHIHLLIKLAGWAEAVHREEFALAPDDDLHRLVSEAEEALRAHGIEGD